MGERPAHKWRAGPQLILKSIRRGLSQGRQQGLPLGSRLSPLDQPLPPLQQRSGVQKALGKPPFDVCQSPFPSLRLGLQHSCNASPAIDRVAAEAVEIRGIHGGDVSGRNIAKDRTLDGLRQTLSSDWVVTAPWTIHGRGFPPAPGPRRQAGKNGQGSDSDPVWRSPATTLPETRLW